MEATEFEEQLSELETRVDRLRALYENWFRGYEKTEPRVARKDVERRVYGMRKELPRNTALRFRYHQLYQRFTTLAQYWARTARQIEEGTYRLQLQRMRRKKEQHQGDHVEEGNGEAQDGDKKKDRPLSYELNLDESLNVDDLLNDLEMDELARAVDSPGPHIPSELPPPARATFAKPKKKLSSRPPARAASPMMRETGSRPPPADRPSKREAFFDDDHDEPTGLHLSLEEDARARGPATPPRSTAGSVAAKLPTGPANGASLPRRTFADGLPAAASPGVPRQTVGDAPPPPPPAARPAASAPRTSVAGVPPPPAAAKGPPSPFVPAPPATLGGPSVPPGAARPPPPPPQAPKPPPPRPAPVPAQSGNTIVGRPPTIQGPPAGGSSLPDQHMRRIYAEYAAARRKNNEGEVRYEALVNSIQKMMPDLQKKHAGKNIDFEVVVKDGRVGLKPKTSDNK
jgi:hypothetical protein